MTLHSSMRQSAFPLLLAVLCLLQLSLPALAQTADSRDSLPPKAQEQVASLHPELVWQRTSPPQGSSGGPVLFQIVFRSSATPGNLPKISATYTLTNSLISDNGASVKIGALSIASSGIITLCCGQTFGSGGITGITAGTGLAGGGASGNIPISIANGGVGNVQLALNAVNAGNIAIGQVVKKLNGLFDNITLAAGTGISLTPVGQTITIANTGVGGGLQISGGTGITTNPNPITGVGTVSIANSGVGNAQLALNAVNGTNIATGQVVKNLNGLFDGVTLAAGSGITITPAGQTLTVASTGGGAVSITAGNGIVVAPSPLTGAGTVGIANGGIGNAQLAANAVNATNIAAGQVVKKLNGLFDNITLAAGAGISITPAGQTLTLSALAASSWSLTGNAATGCLITTPLCPNFLGTTDNNVLEFRTLNNRVLRIEPALDSGSGNSFAPNMIGGFPGNTVGAGVAGATIAGGGVIGLPNTVSANYGTVMGGLRNTASGFGATVAGGQNNAASGMNSFAAGSATSTAGHAGAFVWGDNSTAAVINVSADNQFLARSSGGVTFFTNAGLTTGVSVAAGGGSWASASDRKLKDHLQPVDAKQVLAGVLAMPVTTWNYRTQDASIRHIGPMAQDFYAAFSVGEDDKHITEIDEGGVAFAAIQGLHQVVEEKNAKIAALQAQVDSMGVKVAALEAAVGKLMVAQNQSADTQAIKTGQ